MQKDCWWNENAKSGEDTASLETPITPAENTQTEPPITGTLMQPDEGGEIPADDTQWMFAVTKKESGRNTNFLIDSGDATSVCRQNFADSLGRKTRGPGVELRSATEHKFTATGNTTIYLRTRDGVNVSSAFQITPKNTGFQRSIVPLGQVCDGDNEFTGGTILNEFIGNRIEFERAGGVYRLIAGTSARKQAGSGEIKVVSFEQDAASDADAQPARTGNVPVLPSEARVERRELTHFQFRSWCRHCVRAKGKESPHHESNPGGVSTFAPDLMFMGEDGNM